MRPSKARRKELKSKYRNHKPKKISQLTGYSRRDSIDEHLIYRILGFLPMNFLRLNDTFNWAYTEKRFFFYRAIGDPAKIAYISKTQTRELIAKAINCPMEPEISQKVIDYIETYLNIPLPKQSPFLQKNFEFLYRKGCMMKYGKFLKGLFPEEDDHTISDTAQRFIKEGSNTKTIKKSYKKRGIEFNLDKEFRRAYQCCDQSTINSIIEDIHGRCATHNGTHTTAPLFNSCMRGFNGEFYSYLPVQVAYIYEPNKEEVLARTLVWAPLDDTVYIDRIYVTDRTQENLLVDFITENFEGQEIHQYPDNPFTELSAKMPVYTSVPYLDSFYSFTYDESTEEITISTDDDRTHPSLRTTDLEDISSMLYTGIMCERCEGNYDEDNVYYVEGYGEFCRDCYNHLFTSCDECNYEVHIEDMIYEFNGYRYCEECYVRLVFTCEECDSELCRDGNESEESNVCNSCFADNHFECDDCRDTYHTDACVHIEKEDIDICNYCYNKMYERCNTCYEAVRFSKLDIEGNCPDCAETTKTNETTKTTEGAENETLSV